MLKAIMGGKSEHLFQNSLEKKVHLTADADTTSSVVIGQDYFEYLKI